MEVREETADSVEKTEEDEDIDVSDDSEEFEASEVEEDGVDTADGGESNDTRLGGFAGCSESESESTVRLIESSGRVPNRLSCSGVRYSVFPVSYGIEAGRGTYVVAWYKVCFPDTLLGCNDRGLSVRVV